MQAAPTEADAELELAKEWGLPAGWRVKVYLKANGGQQNKVYDDKRKLFSSYAAVETALGGKLPASFAGGKGKGKGKRPRTEEAKSRGEKRCARSIEKLDVEHPNAKGRSEHKKDKQGANVAQHAKAHKKEEKIGPSGKLANAILEVVLASSSPSAAAEQMGLPKDWRVIAYRNASDSRVYWYFKGKGIKERDGIRNPKQLQAHFADRLPAFFAPYITNQSGGFAVDAQQSGASTVVAQPLPENWREVLSKSTGKVYYYNELTGESTEKAPFEQEDEERRKAEAEKCRKIELEEQKKREEEKCQTTMEVQEHAQKLFGVIYDSPITEEAAVSILDEYPELSFLANRFRRCPLPPGWTSMKGDLGQVQYINTDGAESTETPPLLQHFAELARLTLHYLQDASAVNDVANALAAKQQVATEEAARLRKDWTGPHTDPNTGVEFWHRPATGRSCWGDPGMCSEFLARTADKLRRALPGQTDVQAPPDFESALRTVQSASGTVAPPKAFQRKREKQGTTVDGVAHGNGDEDAKASTKIGADLQGLALGKLRRIAREEGITDKEIDEAEDNHEALGFAQYLKDFIIKAWKAKAPATGADAALTSGAETSDAQVSSVTSDALSAPVVASKAAESTSDRDARDAVPLPPAQSPAAPSVAARPRPRLPSPPASIRRRRY